MFDDKEEEKPVQNPLRLKKLMELIEALGLMPDPEEGKSETEVTVIEADPKKLEV